MTRGKVFGLAFAALLLAVGGWLTIEGLGWGSGSATSRSWATLGPILVGFGIALVVVIFPKRR